MSERGLGSAGELPRVRLCGPCLFLPTTTGHPETLSVPPDDCVWPPGKQLKIKFVSLIPTISRSTSAVAQKLLSNTTSLSFTPERSQAAANRAAWVAESECLHVQAQPVATKSRWKRDVSKKELM